MLVIRDIMAQGQYLLAAILPAMLLTFAWHMVSCRKHPPTQRLRGLRTRGWLLLFLTYLITMLISTLLARPETDPLLYVFDHLWFTGDEAWNKQIIENILLFIPFAALFLQTFRPGKPWRAGLSASLCTTLLIEGGQLVFRRGAFQFSDILYNLVGGAVGCWLWQLIHRLYVHRKNRLPGQNSRIQDKEHRTKTWLNKRLKPSGNAGDGSWRRIRPTGRHRNSRTRRGRPRRRRSTAIIGL